MGAIDSQLFMQGLKMAAREKDPLDSGRRITSFD